MTLTLDKFKAIRHLRNTISGGKVSVGSWMQICNSDLAEIMGSAGYDWVAVDLEHAAFSRSALSDVFRALELHNTLPFARVAEATPTYCKQALDSGACGIILPMIHSADQLSIAIKHCKWPPKGKRGVGFSRANLFGNEFTRYSREAQETFVVAMIESEQAVENVEEIASVSGLDAVMIGPYDLTASMGITGEFNHPKYTSTLERISSVLFRKNMPFGIHIVDPDPNILNQKIQEGYRFIAYSIDSVFLNTSSKRPPSIVPTESN